ncbi:CmpA/NrtA family ABC transporter substrate-binding protein [Coraliomargarita sp. SDUM461004]|uniref:CmpA/NrtA family ABC transporter substrate-binding protein n=1 Tax=Thalassobacterium sedimentorum TaxID=3041258 RepID=A0ABU1AGF7_9BACT|nr:CmpA/NrtA family ABC transporter substrate-binding protein [Coraliomargarita sp. SDUM461004]MDQ8193876.1 CmpA/NrtA family ABC transporter substrate-binding protein [Coraliomargarita sp. SDUM461004]
MFTPAANISARTRRSASIKLGYVRLLDAAPLIIADCLGFFREAGVDVNLTREVGWATIRDKLAFGELDVVQALSPLPFVMQMGINVATTEVITGMVLNCNGNAITLSNQLREEGVDDGPSLRRYINTGFNSRKLVIGVVSLASSHHFMLCRWLDSLGINPKQDVIISVLPPDQMVRNLASNNIDGICVGEPWNSLAVEEELGWCVATSEQIAKGYPEKVLATTERFYSYRGEEYIAMIQALRQACEYCDNPNQRIEMLKILSKSKYLNCSPKTLSHAFSTEFPMGYAQTVHGEFIRFSGRDLNCPDLKRAALVYDDLLRFMPHNVSKLSTDLIPRVFRESIYAQAAGLCEVR